MLELVAKRPHPAFGHFLPRKIARAKANNFLSLNKRRLHSPCKTCLSEEAHFWRLPLSSTLTVRCQGLFRNIRIFILGRVWLGSVVGFSGAY